MAKKIILNIFGQSEHGKDTLAEALISRMIDYRPCYKTAYAKHIKETAIAMTGMPREVAFGNQEARANWSFAGLTAREWQRKVGDWGRSVDEDFWIKRWAKEINALPPNSFVTSCDGRLNRELHCSQTHFDPMDTVYLDCLIRRPGHVSKSADMSHRTEYEPALMNPDQFKFYLENRSGSVDALEECAEVLARQIRRYL